jgi:hypothetical protein
LRQPQTVLARIVRRRRCSSHCQDERKAWQDQQA